VRDKLVDEIYKTIKLKINQQLNVCKYRSFFMNETINIRKERIINLYCHVSSLVTSNKKSFHLKAMIEIAEKMNAAVQVE
jgi:hypothetical protein